MSKSLMPARPNLETTRRLHFQIFPSWEVPPHVAARIVWDDDEVGVKLELSEDLSHRDQLRAIAWASAILPGYLWSDGDGFASHAGLRPVLPMSHINRYGRAINLVECADCEFQFDPDTSTSRDLCPSCALDVVR